MVAASELPINERATAMQMAQTIFGDGVTVVGASYTGDSLSSATYSNGDSIAPGVMPGDTGVILSTGRARDFANLGGLSNQDTSTSANGADPDNNAPIDAAAGLNGHDASSYLDIDFVPSGDAVAMQFKYSSAEYPEHANSLFEDLVGVWANGQRVDVAAGNGDAETDDINSESDQNLNAADVTDLFHTDMGGFTVSMLLKMVVTPDVVNSIRIRVSDGGDSKRINPGLVISAQHVPPTLQVTDDTVTMAIGSSTTVDVTANDIGPGNTTLFITHINGQAVTAGSIVTLATGQQITLNADGTLTILADLDVETVSFSYTVGIGSGNGIFDVGLVTIDSVPCFVAGTMILTPDGEVPVESLQSGDLVITQDEGPQPVRWAGRRRVEAAGNFAPIQIAANTFGDHRELLLSPLHRVLINDGLAELFFGETEVLVAARDLVNDQTVRRVEGGHVEYVHILFDRHQVVFSEGLATESFLPGPQTEKSFEAEMVAEICTLFPEIDMKTGQGYSPSARRGLRPFEARVLLNGAKAA